MKNYLSVKVNKFTKKIIDNRVKYAVNFTYKSS